MKNKNRETYTRLRRRCMVPSLFEKPGRRMVYTSGWLLRQVNIDNLELRVDISTDLDLLSESRPGDKSRRISRLRLAALNTLKTPMWLMKITMDFSNLDFLIKLSGVVQVLAIVLIFLGGALQASKFFPDKRINSRCDCSKRKISISTCDF